MAPQFQVAEAYADFHVDVDKGIDEAVKRLKARAKDMEIKAHLDFSADTKKVEAQLKKLGLDKIKPKIAPELDVPATRRASKQTEDAMSKVAARANAKFSALAFTALTVGLPAAAAVGAAGVGVALSAIPAMFVGAGALLQKNNAVIENSFISLKNRTVGSLEEMSNVMVGPLLSASDQLGSSFERSSGLLRTGFERSADLIEPLVGVVTDAAENALPGLVDSLDESRDAIDGVRKFAGQAGRGLGEFATEASKGAKGTDEGLTILGGTVRTLEGRFGTLFANLANGSAGPLRSLDVIVDQVSQGLVNATSSGSGTMAAFQGMTTAGAGAATVLSGVLTAVSALPAPLMQFAGTATSAALIAGRFGIDAGKGFDGLGDKIKAQTSTADKFKTTISGLATGAVHPAFLAVSALTIGLDILGRAQQKAAAYTAEHRESVRQMTDAIRADNGVLGENVNKVNSKALADKNAAANLASFSATMGEATLAIQGNDVAYQALLNKGTEGLRQTMASTGATKDQIDAYSQLAKQALDTGSSYDELTKGVGASVFAFDAEGAAVDLATDAQKMHGAEIINGLGVVGEQINVQRQAHQEYLQVEHALSGLSHAQIEARDATTQHTAAIYEQMNASLGHRGAVLNTKTAVDELAKVNQNAKSTEDQKAAAMLNAETAMARQIAAAGELAASNAGAVSDSQRLEVQTRAQNAETIKLANSWAGPLPASLQTAISKMSVTEAKAAGLKIGVNNLGQAVATLPNGKEIILTSTAAAAEAKVHELQAAINALHGKDIKIAVSYYGTGPRPSSLTGPNVAFASGGRPKDKIPHLADGGPPLGNIALDARPGGRAKGPGTGTSDSILAAISTEEMVIKARETAKNLTELYAINNGQRNYEKYPETGRPPDSGMRAAAAEALRQVESGGQFFEDFSFRGSSANMNSYNDRLADQFYAAKGPGWDFDGTERTRSDIAAWLKGFIGETTTRAATVAATAGVQAATFTKASARQMTSRTDGNVTINVYAQPEQDLNTLAEVVSRKIELSRRVA